MAYEIARECMSSFKESDPSPEQIKQNLDLMRKAAFSGGIYRVSRVEESKQTERKKVTEDKSKRAHVVRALAELKKSHVVRAKVQADLNVKAKSLKPKPVETRKPENTTTPPRASRKSKNTTKEVVIENVPEEIRKRKFSSDIFEKAKTLAEALPRGITVRPSGKWVSVVSIVYFSPGMFMRELSHSSFINLSTCFIASPTLLCWKISLHRSL